MRNNNPKTQENYQSSQGNYQPFPPLSRAQIQMNSYTRQPVGYVANSPQQKPQEQSFTNSTAMQNRPAYFPNPQPIPGTNASAGIANSQSSPTTVNNQGKKASPKNLILFVVSSLILVLIIGVAAFILNQQGYFGSNQTAFVSSSSSRTSSQESSSGQAFYFPRFFNPRENPGNSSIPAADTPLPERASSQASRSLPNMATVNLSPSDTAKLDRRQFQSLTCSSTNFTTHGVVELRNQDNPGTSMLVATADMILTPADQANFDRANNFIQKNTDFMADRDTDFGPDFLQFLRKDCAKSQIQRFKEFDNVKMDGTDASRTIADLRGQNENLDVSVNILAKKDKHLILISRLWAVQEFFSRDQIQKCVINNTPNRSCFRDLLEKESNLQRRLEDEAARIAKVYAI